MHLVVTGRWKYQIALHYTQLTVNLTGVAITKRTYKSLAGYLLILACFRPKGQDRYTLHTGFYPPAQEGGTETFNYIVVVQEMLHSIHTLKRHLYLKDELRFLIVLIRYK